MVKYLILNKSFGFGFLLLIDIFFESSISNTVCLVFPFGGSSLSTINQFECSIFGGAQVLSVF